MSFFSSFLKGYLYGRIFGTLYRKIGCLPFILIPFGLLTLLGIGLSAAYGGSGDRVRASMSL